MSKNYAVKINDFKNLKTKIQIDQDQDLKNQVQDLESTFNLKIEKTLLKGKNIVLAIAKNQDQDPIYLITGRACYQKSILNILDQIQIDQDQILIDPRKKQDQDLDLESLKKILIQ